MDIKVCVVLFMLVLLIFQFLVVVVLQFYGMVVDVLVEEGVLVLMFGVVGLIVVYGVVCVMQIGFQNLCDVIFVCVGQWVLWQLVFEIFIYIYCFLMCYYIMCKIGGLSCIVEWGVKGVEFLLWFLLFFIGFLIL